MNPDHLRRELQKLYEKGKFSDLNISCHGHTLQAHRIILCSQSDFFLAACTGDFQESLGKVDLTDDHLHLIRRIMDLFYCGDYSDPTEGDEGNEEPLSMLELHAEMYALGDKYQAPGLSRLAMQNYEGRLKRDWVPQIFLRSIANRELRNATFRHARSNIEQFQSDDAMRIQFKGTCLDVPESAVDLLQSYIDVPLRGDCSQCGRRQPVEPTQLRCLKCGKGGAR